MRGIIFCFCNKRLNIHLQCFGLGCRSSNSFAKNQRISHIGQHRLTMSTFPSQMVDFFIMSHLCLFLV